VTATSEGNTGSSGFGGGIFGNFWSRTPNFNSDITTTTTTTTNTTQQRIINELKVDVINNQYDFGNYVSNFAIQPYIRSQLVAFAATLRPNTRVYAFFDDKPVSAFCAPGILNPDLIVNDIVSGKEYIKVRQNGQFGSPLVTDSKGRLFGVFRIPEGTFRIGDRTFMLLNVDDPIVGAQSIVTSARAIFTASNVSVSREQLVLSTQEPILSYNSNIDNRVVTDTNVSTNTVRTYIETVYGNGYVGGSNYDSGGGGGGNWGWEPNSGSWNQDTNNEGWGSSDNSWSPPGGDPSR
jgi:hypothetical protein